MSLPNGRVETVSAGIAFVLIEFDRLGVGLCHGERDFRGAQAGKAESGLREQHSSQTAAAEGWVNADLGQVSALPAHAGAEDKGGQFAAGPLHHDIGRLLRKVPQPA